MFKRLKTFILSGLLLLLGVQARARINMLEPWSPGMDFRVPKFTWNHAANLRMGFGDKADFFEGGYILTTPLSPEWEVGGSLGFLSVNRSPGDDSSGLNDLHLAAKYKFPKSKIRGPIDLIAEMGASLPTGDSDDGLGAGGIGLFGGMGVQAPMSETFTGYAHVGLRLYTEGDDTRLGKVISYTFGGKYRVDEEWVAAVDIRGFNHDKDKINGVKQPKKVQESYFVPGAIWRPKGMAQEFLGSLLIGLTNTSYDFGLMAGVKF